MPDPETTVGNVSDPDRAVLGNIVFCSFTPVMERKAEKWKD